MDKLIDRLLYMPPQYTYTRNYFRNRCSYSEIDGMNGYAIPMVFIKAINEAQYTIVYSHANAEDIGQLGPFLKEMSQQLDCDIVCYDYPGYGRNTEPITEQNMKNTGVRVVEYLVNSLRIHPEKIILFGHSLGSAISAYAAVHLAEKLDIRVGGVVLQSCFLSIMQVALPFRKSPKSDLYVTSEIIGRVQSPVCLIHGKEDVIVPIMHAKRIFLEIPEKYRYRCLFIDNAGHNNLEYFCQPRDLYYQFLREFAEYLTRFKMQELRSE